MNKEQTVQFYLDTPSNMLPDIRAEFRRRFIVPLCIGLALGVLGIALLAKQWNGSEFPFAGFLVFIGGVCTSAVCMFVLASPTQLARKFSADTFLPDRNELASCILSEKQRLEGIRQRIQAEKEATERAEHLAVETERRQRLEEGNTGDATLDRLIEDLINWTTRQWEPSAEILRARKDARAVPALIKILRDRYHDGTSADAHGNTINLFVAIVRILGSTGGADAHSTLSAINPIHYVTEYHDLGDSGIYCDIVAKAAQEELTRMNLL